MVEWILDSMQNVCHGLGQRVCPIYRLERNSKGVFLVGTGVPFHTGSSAFLLTAAHVLDELTDDTLVTTGSEQLVRFRYGSSRFAYRRGSSVDVDLGRGGHRIRVAAIARRQTAAIPFCTAEVFGLSFRHYDNAQSRRRTRCVYRKLDSAILVMKAAKDRRHSPVRCNEFSSSCSLYAGIVVRLDPGSNA
jgi:hypothetical protein